VAEGHHDHRGGRWHARRSGQPHHRRHPGTTDTAAGSVVGLDRGTTAASKFLRGGRTDLNAVVTTGTVELVGASSVDGAVTIYVTWIPLTDGATLVAA
jgi:hypothetical protein